MPTNRTVPDWVKRAKRGEARGRKHGYKSGLEVKTGQLIRERTGKPPRYETLRIPYVVPQSTHHYKPDFPLPNHIIVETKGIWDATDRAKMLFVTCQYPELDIRMVFSNANAKLYKGSPTSYAQWCDQHGIRWANRAIPDEWFDEPIGNREDPEVVIKRGPFGYARGEA